MLLAMILVPLLLGAVLIAVRPLRDSALLRTVYVTAALVLDTGLTLAAVMRPHVTAHLWRLSKTIMLEFCIDSLSQIFLVMTAVLWLLAGLFAFGYLKHDPKAGRFLGIYLMTFGAMAGIESAANLVTLYLCFELLTLISSMLVFHPGTHESAMAGLKYLFYSIGGAFLALLGIFCFAQMNVGLRFIPGGVYLRVAAVGGEGGMLIATALILLGVGAKAGMFPLHGWLPTAHPVAPAPASAVLSALIVKAGVFFSIRIAYYIVGVQRLRGTWVQTVWLTLALITVFMGSMLAYMEPVLKKRLAYSTVSQASYILFGLASFSMLGFVGALLQTVYHAAAKTGLFLSAGAYIEQTGKTRVAELNGVGHRMPITTAAFAVFGLSLVGIPPLPGFVSKWYLAVGAETLGAVAYIGPAVLLISALLTAGYLFPLPVRGFLNADETGAKEASPVMTLPLLVLALGVLLLGVFTEPLIRFLVSIADLLLL